MLTFGGAKATDRVGLLDKEYRIMQGCTLRVDS